jgi:hypothetical protein
MINHLAKIIPLLFLIGIGFAIGRFTANRVTHKTETTQTVKQQETQVAVSTSVTNTVRANKTEITSYSEKYFNKKGILVKEIEKKSHNGASDVSFTNHTDLNVVNSTVTSDTFSNTETSYQSTWLLGFSVPMKSHPEFQDLNVQLGYRVLGPVYLTMQSDYKFSKPTVGFAFNF